METLLRLTDSTSITTNFSESGPAYFSPQGASRTLDHWVGPVGIHHIVEECRVLWRTGRRLQLIPAGLPRDQMPILLTLRYTLQPQRGEAAAPQYEGKWDHQAIADCLQKGDKRVEFLKAVNSSFEKAKPKFEALREDPTPDAHWALWIDCMREPARTFFSLYRTAMKDDAKRRLSALRRKLVSEQATRREQMGKFGETYGHMGDFSEQHLHARHRLLTLNWQLRRWSRQAAAARRMSLETELHKALKEGRRREIHRLTQLLGGKGVGVRKRLFFHLPGSRPDKEGMKTHVTRPGPNGGMDAEVVDIWETERKFQADLPPLEPLDMNMVTRAKTILFSTANELAKGNRRRAAPRWSAPAELFLMCASPSYLSVGPRRLEGIGVEEITKEAKRYTRAKLELVSVLVHAQRALHTPCCAHYSNGTLIDKRNGRKGMLGTRIIHVLCPWWKSLFAAVVGETVSEGGDEHFSPNWHGFLRGRRREGEKERRSDASTTMHGMAPDLAWEVPSEFAH